MPIEMVNCPKCGVENSVKREVCFDCGSFLRPAPEVARKPPRKRRRGPEPPPPPFPNTSGQGKAAAIPPEARTWNCGAFFFTWIWGIAHHTWISLLALVPCVSLVIATILGILKVHRNTWVTVVALIPYTGFIIATILGLKGSEWAWRNRRYEFGVEQFQRVQAEWTKWVLLLLLAIVASGILCGIALGIYTLVSAYLLRAASLGP